MPYISTQRRNELRYSPCPETPGELNYWLHEVIEGYLLAKDKIGYNELNDVLGALEAVKQEFYRRKVAPYEDNKIKENGDISLYENG